MRYVFALMIVALIVMVWVAVAQTVPTAEHPLVGIVMAAVITGFGLLAIVPILSGE